jgi:antitoxin (DNA-binding transcriptional repressor) of toxin-antitoxin stability system
MMTLIKIEDMQNNPQICLAHIRAGEQVQLTENGKPIAQITPVRAAPVVRLYGLCANQFVVPADFDSALPDDILRDFEA